ncbi:hypothetical protein RO21_06435 [[Actinobacillus] muris]|uniref:Mce/MlaD domain-containing protein n=1 Tax=Muribacter muris TaxID=67855 RepID=A0A0J5S3R7_9PAST|nr:MlaD family protein [Muribacter muris]KMK51437.1 hypothetical protein RO21_06435 [[Actinobacillus] muris] [Muribacter muris]
MTETTSQPVAARVRQPRKISPFWLLPIVAFAIGALLFFQILKEQGEKITIRFKEGDGITAGKTMIRYQGLQIGQVKKVYFVNDLKEVQIEAEINPEAKSVLKEGTKFWLVKPSASLAGVSGLDALVSGNYITLLPTDESEAKNRYDFIAEEEPPAITVTDGDLLVRLVSDDLGSITVGASVYFRKVPVGNIADYRFTHDQKKVEIDVVIDKKYANLVKKASHFWNISGVNINAGLAGLNVEVDSLASVVQGAVAFDSPDDSPAAAQGQKFALFENLKAALRGTEVKVNIPIAPNLKVNETPVYYQNLQIGVLSQLEMPTASATENPEVESTPKGMLQGTLLIDPNHLDLLRSGSHILLREPRFDLNKEQISKIGELFRGIYFDIKAGKGEPQRHFTVERESDYLLNLPNVLALTLTAPKAYGVEKGQGIYYNDVQVGEILKRRLSLENVTFEAIIFPNYRHLIAGNTQFIAISNVDVSVGLDGLRVHSGSPSEWLKGGIRILPHKPSGEPKTRYPLYKNAENAEAGIVNDDKRPTLTLTATELSGIDKGSLVLFRQFQIGEVLNIRPHKNQFSVDLYIDPKHRHLVGDTSRFWIEPAVQVDLSGNGLTVQASPLMRSLKGAISVDNHGSKGNKTLYASYAKATSGNTYLTLFAKDGSKLSKGMPIKYMGLTVGTIERLQLDNAKKQIKATAYIEGQYYPLIAKSGSRFNAVSPEIDTTGVKNLDAVVQNYLNVEVGGGERKTQFQIADTDTAKTLYGNGFPIIIETSDANGITPQAPVMYRGMQVGSVQRLSLSELGDRVLIHLRIANQYKHLVRKNSEFWASSGYTMDISLSGASINSGTMSQLLNGGITFSTPSGRVVQPQAEPNRRFRLQRKTPDEAPSWDQGVAE